MHIYSKDSVGIESTVLGDGHFPYERLVEK